MQATMENLYDFIEGTHPLSRRLLQLAQAVPPATPAAQQEFPPERDFLPRPGQTLPPSNLEHQNATQEADRLPRTIRDAGKSPLMDVLEKARKRLQGHIL